MGLTDTDNQATPLEGKKLSLFQGRFSTGLALGLIVLFSLIAYANSLQGDFIWDDWSLIVNNESIKSWDNLAKNLSLDFTQKRQDEPMLQRAGYYRPLSTFFFMLDYSLWGENPLGYHITNLLWHAANGVVIYFFTLLLFKENTLALMTSLLFATHPIHAEAVSWIAGVTGVICSFFFFASLYLYCLGDSEDRRKQWLFSSLSWLSFLLALYAKEMAATLPLILILIDYYKHSGFQDLGKRIKSWLPYWLILFVFLFIRLGIVGLAGGEKPYLASMGKLYLLLTLGRALIYYLSKLVFPLNLSSHVVIDLVTQGLPYDVMLSLVLFFGSLLFVYFKRKTWPKVSFSILFFWLSLLPISNIVPMSGTIEMQFPVAERFLYLPSFAFCLLSAILLCRLNGQKFKQLSLGTLIFIPLLLFYTAGTIHANTFWQNGIVLSQRELEKNPQSFLLNYSLADAYVQRKDYDQAIRYFLKSLQLNPDLSITHAGLAYCYYVKKDLQKAIAENQAALRCDDSFVAAHFNLGICYWKTGEYALAVNELTKVHKLDPNYQPAINTLKTIYQEIKEKSATQQIKCRGN